MSNIASARPVAQESSASSSSRRAVSWIAGATGTVKSRWMAYIARRLEQTALQRLAAMSDRDLKDIGITRSDLNGIASGQRPFTRYY